MMTTKISVEPYVAEYARGKYFDDKTCSVKFPSSLDLYVLIWDLMQRRPVDCPVDRGNLEFCLPDRRQGKAPEIYNYLSERSAKVIERKLKLMLWAELHEFIDEQKHLHGVQFKESVYIFMTRYGLESITEDALLKHYQRFRDRTRRRSKREYIRRKNR